MKFFRKITSLQFFHILLLTLFSFALFSCASTPKQEEKLPEDSVSAVEIPETENSEKNNLIIEDSESTPESTEENSSTTEETDSEDGKDAAGENQDFSDLTEPLTKEQNPELPELPELSEKTEENPENEAVPTVIQEPQVKDEPSPETTENNNQKENTLPEQNISAAEEKKQNALDDEAAGADTDTTNIIEETENSSETEEQESEPAGTDIQKPSRSVKIKKNQNIDIVYPGKGWIYQGNIDENGNVDARNRNFIFGGRKLGGKDTSFTLRSRNAGTYLLHFFKNDMLTGKYIDDFLEVIVENESTSSTEHITVPDYAEVVPPKFSITAENAEKMREQKKTSAMTENSKPAEKNSAAKAKNVQKNPEKEAAEISKTSNLDTIIQTTESAPSDSAPAIKSKAVASSSKNEVDSDSSSGLKPESSRDSSDTLENLSQDGLLELAQKYYDEKKYQQAFSVISKFFDTATERLDEGLFLQAQILEEKSPVQNIKSAIESYDLVVNNYPSSSLWDKANRRSIFLKRFYINIR